MNLASHSVSAWGERGNSQLAWRSQDARVASPPLDRPQGRTKLTQGG